MTVPASEPNTLRHKKQATLSVAYERETTFSRVARRVYAAFGAERQPAYERSLAGSGVIVDHTHGLIASSAHLLREDGRLVITLFDDQTPRALPTEVTGEVAAIDDDSHALIIAVPPEALVGRNAVTWGRSADLRIRDTIETIVTSGNTSKLHSYGAVLNTDVELRARDPFRQGSTLEPHTIACSTDEPLFGEGPGSPIFDKHDSLVGLVTLHMPGMLYAIPIEHIAPLIESAAAKYDIDFPGMP